MPIKIASNLPALKVLESENIFVMSHERAASQDIRPLKILILNLMPTKMETETQLLRLLSNTPLQVEVELLQTESYHPKNTPKEHLLNFYTTFSKVRHQKYDGMIITGAPVEQMRFDQTDYWKELCDIMDWTRHNVYATMHICWGAQAGLYYHYQIEKQIMSEKLSGVFEHRLMDDRHPLVRGFDEVFMMPHSRHTEIDAAAVRNHPQLQILADSELAGPTIISAHNGRQIFITGHCEYDLNTLANEYYRDVHKGLHPRIPYHYFPGDDPDKQPMLTWRSHANLLFYNWLNYFVYQQTPFDLTTLDIIS